MEIFIVISCIVFCASIISGMLSFGFGLTSIPFLSIFLSPVEVVGLITLINVLNSILILRKQRNNVEWKHIIPLLLGGVVGVPIGVHLLATANPGTMKILIGVLIILLGISLLLGFGFTIKKHKHKIMGGSGFFGGILAGGTGIIGAPMAIFFKSIGMKKNEFRANLIAYLFIMASLTIFMMSLKGMVDKKMLLDFVVLIPVMIIGTHVGHILGDKVSPVLFKKIVITVAIVAGGVSIFKGITML